VLRREAREVWEALRDDVLPVYEKNPSPDYEHAREALEKVLHKWAEKYRLHVSTEDTELYDYVLRILKQWKRYPDYHLRDLDVTVSPGTAFWSSEFPGVFQFNWCPWVESERAARKRIKKDLDEYLTCFFDQARQDLRRDGWEVERRRYKDHSSGSETSDFRHIEWLVLFQVKGIERSEIARQYNVRPDAVRKGISKAARLFGLTPRSGKTGRPRGKT